MLVSGWRWPLDWGIYVVLTHFWFVSLSHEWENWMILYMMCVAHSCTIASFFFFFFFFLIIIFVIVVVFHLWLDETKKKYKKILIINFLWNLYNNNIYTVIFKTVKALYFGLKVLGCYAQEYLIWFWFLPARIKNQGFPSGFETEGSSDSSILS